MEHAVQEATRLMLAAASGDTEAVDALLAAGADIRCCSDNGRTALGDALAHGHLATAQRLVQHAQLQPDCNTILSAAVAAASSAMGRTWQYNTRLASAAEQGYHQLVPLLVTPGNIDGAAGVWGGRLTPLHLACKHRHTNAAEALLNAGAAVTIPDQQGRIPLVYAIQYSKDPQLHVRLLQAMRQQQPAAAGGEAALIEPVITAAASLGRRAEHAAFTTRLLAAVMAAWGSDAAAALLRGLLKRLATSHHSLAEALLLGWRQAQRRQLDTHSLIDRLQRLVLDPLAIKRQQQQRPLLASHHDRALSLRLPMALLMGKAGAGQGQAPGSASSGTSASTLAAAMLGISLDTDSNSAAGIAAAAGQGGLAELTALLTSLLIAEQPPQQPSMAHLSFCTDTNTAATITAAAGRGSMRDVAALLAALPISEQPAALLVAAQAAGSTGHSQLCDAVLQQFAALDWEASSRGYGMAPCGDLVRAAAAPPPSLLPPPPPPPGQRATISHGTQQQQQQRPGCGPGTSFCLYSALLNSWQGVGQVVARELMQQVVAAVEATAGHTEGAA